MDRLWPSFGPSAWAQPPITTPNRILTPLPMASRVCLEKTTLASPSTVLFGLRTERGRERERDNLITLNKNINATCKVLAPCFMSGKKISQKCSRLTKNVFI